MEGRSVRGVERVRAKLEACISSGNYYEAHQMYRTLYFRYLSQKKYLALIDLLKGGADVLLDHGQQSSGADLSILYVQVLREAGTKPDESNFSVVANLFSRMLPEMPEREKFISEAMSWSTNETHKSGHPSLHRLVAQTYWKEKNYTMARHHFLHSSDGQGCATMLVELHRLNGYANEVDLFIAQAVLQYLCLQNKNSATAAFNSYTTQHPNIRTGPPYLLPLLNFIWFLLKAIESGELIVFTILCERYQLSIQRDPTYPEYLCKIGQIFFGATQPQTRNHGFFGNLFQSFGTLFNEESDSEDGPATSAATAGSSSHCRRSVHKMETEDVD